MENNVHKRDAISILKANNAKGKKFRFKYLDFAAEMQDLETTRKYSALLSMYNPCHWIIIQSKNIFLTVLFFPGNKIKIKPCTVYSVKFLKGISKVVFHLPNWVFLIAMFNPGNLAGNHSKQKSCHL